MTFTLPLFTQEQSVWTLPETLKYSPIHEF